MSRYCHGAVALLRHYEQKNTPDRRAEGGVFVLL